MKTVFLNGAFLPESEASVSIFDRGFLYGDGLFETIKVCNGTPFRWQAHWERLQRGAALLRIDLPFQSEEAKSISCRLLQENQQSECILRMQVTRGRTSRRGYSVQDATDPTFAMTLHESPVRRETPLRWRVKSSSFQIEKKDPLAGIKSSNKLLQILAKTEAEEAGCDEALIVNSEGQVTEGTSGNVFWIRQGSVFTPPLHAGCLPGVTRQVVFELCKKLKLNCVEQAAELSQLQAAEGLFLSLTSLGIVEVSELDGRAFCSTELVSRLLQSYHELVALETSK